MDESGFWVALGLLVIAAFACGPVALGLAIGSRRRLRHIETLLAQSRDAARQSLPGGAPERPEAGPPSAEAAKPTPEPQPWAPAEPPFVSAPATIEPSRHPKPSFEERVGTRWTVWVGGAALALGAVLLVRYSIEQRWLGPGARIVAGLLVAMALVAAGEILRRRRPDPAAIPDRPDIPAMLTAAGTVAAFGSVYAAFALYQLIGAGTAFVTLGLVGIAAMLAAALHGPSLAALGLMAALGAPLLLGTSTDSRWPIALYTTVVVASAYGLARFKLWFWLAVSAAAGAGAWILVLALDLSAARFDAVLTAAVIHTAMAVWVFAVLPYRRPGALDDLRPDYRAEAILTAAAALLLLVLAAGPYGLSWVVGSLIGVAVLAAAGAWSAPAAGALTLAGVLTLGLLGIWPAAGGADFFGWTMPVAVATFLIVAILAAAAVAFQAGWRLWRSNALPAANAYRYALAATLTPLGALVVAEARIAQAAVSPGFAVAAALLAVAFAFAAGRFSRRVATKPDAPTARLGEGVMAAAAVAALSSGFVYVLSGGSLDVALALTAAGVAYLGRRLALEALRLCAAGLAVAVVGRSVWLPFGSTSFDPTSSAGVLWAYGGPALAVAVAAFWIVRREAPEDRPTAVTRAAALVLAMFFVVAVLRLVIYGDLVAPRSGLLEQGLLATSGFGFAIVALALNRSSRVFAGATTLVSLVLLIEVWVGLLVAANPVVSGEAVQGGAFVNALWTGYLVPGILALVLARRARTTRPPRYVMVMQATGFALLFTYVSLQVRVFFHGPLIGWTKPTGNAELYAYSPAWLLVGLGVLGYGLWRQSAAARAASALFILASVAKVFLIDLAGVEGLLRALSFLGLGVVLIGIGWVYQTLVFVPKPSEAAPP